MKNLITKLATVIAGCLLMVACSTYEDSVGERTTTTNYDASGKITSIVVVEKDVKSYKELTDARSFSESLQDVDKDKASDRSASYTNFCLGYGDVGLTWKSVDANSTRAPASASASDKVLKAVAEVKKAQKTTIQTDNLGVNADTAQAASLKK